jgi:hypothetical protein
VRRSERGFSLVMTVPDLICGSARSSTQTIICRAFAFVDARPKSLCSGRPTGRTRVPGMTAAARCRAHRPRGGGRRAAAERHAPVLGGLKERVR